MANAKDRVKIKKKRTKIFRKVRNNNSFGTFFAYLFLLVLFSAIFVTIAGFFVEYILESKFYEEYSKLSTVAEIYEGSKSDDNIIQTMMKTSNDFLITDKTGNILHQKGKNTCSFEGNTVYLSDKADKFLIYKDSDSDYLYPGKDGYIKVRWKQIWDLYSKMLFDKIEFTVEGSGDEAGDEADDEPDAASEDTVVAEKKLHEAHGVYVTLNADSDDVNGIRDIDSIKIPLWVSIDAGDGENFVGKMLFSFNIKDVVLVFEIALAIVVVAVVLSILMMISIISGIIKYRRVRNLFYKDFVTDGKNWNWYLINGDKRIHGFYSRNQNWAAVNFVFKNYRNYCLCHSVPEGEEALAKINKVIEGSIDKSEICAHATTSNFALLLRYENEEELRQRLNQLIEELSHIEEEHEFSFQAGVALLPSDSNTINDTDEGRIPRKELFIDDIYNNACSARAVLSDTDESGIQFFDKNLLDDQKWTDIVQERQAAAISGEEFKVYYQPKYNPQDNTLRGAEALIRWQFSEDELVPPGKFIPIFEKNGFITEIDHYMIRHVARDQKMWLDQGYKCVPVSVNVSRAHFIETDLAEQILGMVDEEGCPHNLIEIELTESAFFDDKKAMIETIKKLKSYGFAVSMDDFGAGYSSLNSLKDMPLDVLKLDADFFRGEDAGERGQIVVSEAIRLGKSLNMRIVAEGVEEKEQVEFLASQGCDMIQGYYYAKPMPKSDYVSRMSK
ncbi:MAG: EAL domain-containing protein [Eubacterium sp.]|nr:EAL domain-containing protein [Eubacterium sp.]